MKFTGNLKYIRFVLLHSCHCSAQLFDIISLLPTYKSLFILILIGYTIYSFFSAHSYYLAFRILLCRLFQVHHTFSTAGSDGSISFWDKDSKQRLKVFLSSIYKLFCLSFSNSQDLNIPSSLCFLNFEQQIIILSLGIIV